MASTAGPRLRAGSLGSSGTKAMTAERRCEEQLWTVLYKLPGFRLDSKARPESDAQYTRLHNYQYHVEA